MKKTKLTEKPIKLVLTRPFDTTIHKTKRTAIYKLLKDKKIFTKMEKGFAIIF